MAVDDMRGIVHHRPLRTVQIEIHSGGGRRQWRLVIPMFITFSNDTFLLFQCEWKTRQCNLSDWKEQWTSMGLCYSFEPGI